MLLQRADRLQHEPRATRQAMICRQALHRVIGRQERRVRQNECFEICASSHIEVYVCPGLIGVLLLRMVKC